MASSPIGREGRPTQGFEHYRSILRFSSAPSRLSTPQILEDGQISVDKKTERRYPPWRRPVGRAFFLLNSEFAKLYGEDIPREEADEYAALLQRTFSAFSEEELRVGMESSHLDVDWSGEGEAKWTVDEWPMQASIEGFKEVLYGSETEVGSSWPRSV